MNGTIKKYFDDKGYGFIKGEDKEYFFHVSNLAEPATLSEGLSVTFEVGQNDRGAFAKDVRVVSE